MFKYAVMDNEGAEKWLGHEEVMSKCCAQTVLRGSTIFDQKLNPLFASQVSMKRLTPPGASWDIFRVRMRWSSLHCSHT